MPFILDEAARVTAAEREKDYGPVEDHHSRVAAILNVVFGKKLLPGEAFEAADVSLIHFTEKLVRESHAPKEDNLVDICGYAVMRDRLLRGKR